jgi:hypothetical protein
MSAIREERVSTKQKDTQDKMVASRRRFLKAGIAGGAGPWRQRPLRAPKAIR